MGGAYFHVSLHACGCMCTWTFMLCVDTVCNVYLCVYILYSMCVYALVCRYFPVLMCTLCVQHRIIMGFILRDIAIANTVDVNLSSLVIYSSTFKIIPRS